jgi:hypothetical protein
VLTEKWLSTTKVVPAGHFCTDSCFSYHLMYVSDESEHLVRNGMEELLCSTWS